MFNNKDKKRPGVFRGLLNILFLLVLVFSVRWLVFEVFVIPSGSMYPTLYVNDYVVVSKFDFGLRVPFTQKWVLGPYLPDRNTISVFLSRDEGKYYIKRLVGLPGDTLTVAGDFIVEINGEAVRHEKLSALEKEKLSKSMDFSLKSFEAYKEIGKDFERTILVGYGQPKPSEWSKEKLEDLTETYSPPPGYLFFMGDNRHMSQDGRFFGHIEVERLVGPSRIIAISCESKIMGVGCNPLKYRSGRILKGVHN